jgi:hypothetical protein
VTDSSTQSLSSCSSSLLASSSFAFLCPFQQWLLQYRTVELAYPPHEFLYTILHYAPIHDLPPPSPHPHKMGLFRLSSFELAIREYSWNMTSHSLIMFIRVISFCPIAALMNSIFSILPLESLGFWTLSIVWDSLTRKHNVSETGFIYAHR